MDKVIAEALAKPRLVLPTAVPELGKATLEANAYNRLVSMHRQKGELTPLEIRRKLKDHPGSPPFVEPEVKPATTPEPKVREMTSEEVIEAYRKITLGKETEPGKTPPVTLPTAPQGASPAAPLPMAKPPGPALTEPPKEMNPDNWDAPPPIETPAAKVETSPAPKADKHAKK